MKLEEAKQRLTYINHAYDYGNIYSRDDLEAIDTVLKALEDSIPKEKVREKIKERESKRDNAEMTLGSALFERDINLLEELLGE